jgi:hypothetical protein
VAKGIALEIEGNSARTMPWEAWPRPVAECQRVETPPPFSSLTELMRPIAPVITYLPVAVSYVSHATGRGWPLFLPFRALMGFGMSLVRWSYRSRQDRNEDTT